MQTISRLIGNLLWAAFRHNDLIIKIKISNEKEKCTEYYDFSDRAIIESTICSKCYKDDEYIKEGKRQYFILTVDTDSKRIEKWGNRED